MESTNILQKVEECEEEIEMDMFEPKLGESWISQLHLQQMIVTLKLKILLLFMRTHVMMSVKLKVL